MKSEFRHRVGTHHVKMWSPQNGNSAGESLRVKLELKLRRMWRLIGGSVGTYLSLCFGLLDYLLHIESSWYHYP